RRSECDRPNESTSAPNNGGCAVGFGPNWTKEATLALLYCKHPLERNQRAFHYLRRQLDAWLQIFETRGELLERVQLHIRALAAIAVFVRDKIKSLARRKFLERIAHSALGHDDEFVC